MVYLAIYGKVLKYAAIVILGIYLLIRMIKEKKNKGQ